MGLFQKRINRPVSLTKTYKCGNFDVSLNLIILKPKEVVMMAEKISNIMEKDVYAANENDTIGDVLHILVDKKTSGVPIVNDDKEVVGFISDGDIMKFIAKQDPRIIDMTSFITAWYDVESFEQKLEDLLKINVMELATTRVISVASDDEVDDVARVLGRKKIKKVPVLDEKNHLVGVISRSTIIRYIVSKHLS